MTATATATGTAGAATPAPDTLPLLRPVMPELDVVRGIAVAMVVVYHGFFWSNPAARATGVTRAVLFASQPGWLGVELFFVLSGFLITGILVDARARPDFFRWFYVRRALRILPAYLALLVVMLVAGRVDSAYATLAVFFLVNLAPIFGVGLQYGPPWSLAVEEHFYLLWPAAVRFLSRCALKRTAWTIVLGLPLLRLAWWTTGNIEGLFIYTWFTADGLAMGALLALHLREPGITRQHVTRLGAGCIAAAALLLAVGLPFGILSRKYALGGAAQYTPFCLAFTGLLALALAAGSGRLRSWLDIGWLRFLGEISYGLYLVHVLVFEAFDAWIAPTTPWFDRSDPRLTPIVVRFVASAAVSVLVATLSRRTLEAWFLARKERWSRAAVAPGAS